MSELTYKDLRQKLLQLYINKDYLSAFNLVEREKVHFPDDFREISYWRISLSALSGQIEQAMSIFRECLDAGEWFPLPWLEGDTDLAILRALPEFQEILAICRRRLLEEQGKARPALQVRFPEKVSTSYPLLMALHGNGNSMSSSAGYWSASIDQGWLLAVPQSSQLVGPDAFVWDESETGISEIREHLSALNHAYAIDPAHVVLGGFSRGGGLAVWMALHQSIRTRGFLVLSPYLLPDQVEALSTLLALHRPAGLRGAILVGEEDNVSLDSARQLAELMNTHKLPCALEIRPGLGHQYPEDFAAWISRGLAFLEQK